jgi:hypothetical protein
MVGEADLVEGTASADTVYRVTNEPQAIRLFGASPLAVNVADALQNGAYPVYAVAVGKTAVADEDVFSSLSGNAGVVANVPMTEIVSDVTFTADGTDLTTVVAVNPAGATVAADAVAFDPTTGVFELGAAPSTTLTVSYNHLSGYTTAIGAMMDDEADRLDFLGVLTEDSSAVSTLHGAVLAAIDKFQFVLAIAGAASYIPDTSTYTNPFDSSRIQLLYPARNADAESLVGAYLGMRARIGIDRSGMRKKLNGQTAISHRDMDRPDKENLDSARLVVIEYGARAVRTMNDYTCVSTSNTTEQAYNNGLARLVGDYVTLVVYEVSDPFIGLLHTPGARSNLAAQVEQEMKNLVRLNAIVRYSVVVEEIDSVTARVTVSMELAKPLRNIEAIVVGGDVSA